MIKQNGDIRIRLPHDDDPHQIAEWMPRIPIWQRYHLTREKITYLLEGAITHHDDMFVIEHIGHHLPIGFIWCIGDGMFGRQPYIKQVSIHPDYLGMGLGKALLDYVETHYAQTASHLFLLVSDFNTGAQKFYARQGYTHIGTVAHYVLPDVDELIYCKQLEV